MKKRLGILVIDAQGGIIGRYINYVLECIYDVITDLHIIFNGDIQDEKSNYISDFCSEFIFLKRDSGCKMYADLIRDAIEDISKYDELVVFDDSFYGPFISFKIIFDEMERSDADFWGITKRGGYLYKDKKIDEYIQNYFIVIRKKIIESPDFLEYLLNFDDYQIPRNKNNHDFDYGFTWFFRDKGYVYDTYVKDDEINVEILSNYDHTRHTPYLMMSTYGLPIIRRDMFNRGKALYLSEGEEIPQVLQYIKNNTNYDIDLIWDDILRKCNISDIKDCLNLNYILNDLNSSVDLPSYKRIVVIAHLYYDELIERCMSYLCRLSETIDIYITSSRTEVTETVEAIIYEKRLKNFKTRKVSNRGRDIGAIFVECRDIALKYDYLCFVHDKKTSGGRGVQTIGQSFFDMIWDNLVISSNYVKNVIATFESEPRLGLLSPPIPIHAGYEMLISRGWTLNYSNTVSEAKKMELRVPLSEKKPPFAFSSCFWCRTSALMKMWTYELSIDDFKDGYQKLDGELNHALERIIIYVAQDAGYYSGVVESEKWASIIQQNLYMHMRRLLKKIDKKNTTKNNQRLDEYLRDKDKRYVYGAGMEGEKAQMILEQIGYIPDGYIVSDDHYDNARSNLSPLIKLSEVSGDNIGIIVAMNEFNEKEAFSNLKDRGIDGAICLFLRD